MILNQLHDFLLASVGASASFIGLLFVALTLVMERGDVNSTVSARDRVLAESAYTALLTIFFISLVGLIPNADISWVLIVFGLLGLTQSLRMFIGGKKHHVYIGNKLILVALIIVYLVIVIYGAYLLSNTEAMLNLDIFFTIIFILYSIALGRSWALIGLRNNSSNNKKEL
ncbi:MAG: hypothetical protein WDN47_05465 [Candidatus Doudnabacteria bacterium]